MVVDARRAEAELDAMRSRALSLAGLKYRLYNVYSPQAAGTVIGESPKPDTKVKKGSTVRINVSKGPKPIARARRDRPSPYATAAGDAQGAGLQGRADERPGLRRPKGTVISENPQGGHAAAHRLDDHPDRLERARDDRTCRTSPSRHQADGEARSSAARTSSSPRSPRR